jgi:hypothetical protein
MHAAHPFALLACALLAGACADRHEVEPGGEPPVAPDGAAPAPDGTPSLDAGESLDEAETRSVSTTIPSIQPGQEQTVCRVLDLGNEAPAMVRAIRASLGAGSHHMIVYRTDDPTTDTHAPCGSIPGGEDTLLIAQRADTVLEYPPGAGLHVPAHQHIRLEIHYINYFGDPIDVDAQVDLDLVPVDDALAPVGVMFTGEFSLTIPPRAEEHPVESFHTVPSGRRLFALTTHTHHRGVYASLRGATGSDDVSGPLLHESYNWAEPPLHTFDPPLTFSSGEGLRITCLYDNNSDDYVYFGMGFDDEMCFLWAYWY